MELIVNAGFGMETATKRELSRFGINAPCKDGRFIFSGNDVDVAKLNLNLSTADRVLIKLTSFHAESFDELFDGIKTVSWLDFIPNSGAIIVKAKSVKSKLFALSAMQSITKKAIVDTLLTKYTSLPEDGEPYIVEVSAFQDEITVSFDTSGAGLHKRGYRLLTVKAPLKETLASGIIELSGWDGERAVVDPFTGSGTFAIECAMRALSIPSGYFRNFAFEKYEFLDSGLLDEQKNLAKERINYDKKLRISGFDIDKKAIAVARDSATRIGLDKYIHFQVGDMRDISSRFVGGVIFANPPYGERIGEQKELSSLYRDFGKMYRSMKDWSAHVITSYNEFERQFGRADKERKVYNAKLLCRIYSYFPKK
ncbi:MAG: class I SAM-dependent RNA methyltransferase [Clostridia bacterium]|nr:class I SAM-dependent RNA methyltransferase [Clostridia bacterium]